MPSFAPWIDIPLAALVYVAAVMGVLYWVRRTDQQSTRRARETTRRVSVRLALLTAGLLLVCYLVGFAFWIAALVAIVLVLAALAGGQVGALGLPLVVLAHLVKEYIMGFPELVLDPPEPTEDAPAIDDRMSALVGRSAIAVAPLRPQGAVEIDGKRLPAASDCGMMISTGTALRVTGCRNGTLLVRESTEGRRTSPKAER